MISDPEHLSVEGIKAVSIVVVGVIFKGLTHSEASVNVEQESRRVETPPFKQ